MGQRACDVWRQDGVAGGTFSKGKAKYGGMEVCEAKRLRSVEDENRRVKTLLADAHLAIAMLKDVNSKKW